jgi:hypothetical protein
MAALVLSAVHHWRVLSLMARLLRMNEIGPNVVLEDLDACHMSREALPNKEIVKRVRAAIAGTFQVKSINEFPMMPEEGYLDLVSAST